MTPRTPFRRDRPSGRFVLRLSPGLHALLRRAARDRGMSLNEYCRLKLSAPLGNLAAVAGAAAVVERAAGLFGEELVGAVAFGSWARGELAQRSDIDVLVVLEDRVPLIRQLYRTWDEEPVVWEDRTVEPQFVHLPPAGETVAGLWGEVATDGIVLFERELRLSARLAQVRRDMLAGRIVRRTAHGQPYWVKKGPA